MENIYYRAAGLISSTQAKLRLWKKKLGSAQLIGSAIWAELEPAQILRFSGHVGSLENPKNPGGL